ncbi:P-loop containing nucleoside triphosphate hydrolase protein [Neurospora hispaniola]|uniref:P-loop containing nucleoside triphosphate hydrolase protein n=1 Tax=Neurospora hispaniola TaxID=588809 RepID=A0AAJ0I7D8_9PEZI|nr:P-loop containing nucleoside triphosphate hydrolase protein [Neurospora hispaniola]
MTQTNMRRANQHARIKREPGSQQPMANSGLARIDEDDNSTVAHSEVERRMQRSDAPSVDTRLAPGASVIGDMDVDGEDEDDECMLMEVKTKTEVVEQDLPTPRSFVNMDRSFIGPGQALKDFGQELKDINDALGELQARGIQHVVSLPELVLVGDQSSGKSSLMSAIAGLSLPRSSGTCTRCPIHIRISRADEWSCRVFLKEDYAFVPRNHPITLQDVTDRDRFPPWVKLDPSRQTRKEFKTIRDRFDAEEIETLLRCAQVAILNPSTPYRFFVPRLKNESGQSDAARREHLDRIKEKEAHGEAQFSPNTVALEVKGPDLADLNFYDLPGVFITAKRPEDRFLERVVRNLTCEYISRQNAIILWAVPMNQDAENSFAFKLIQEMNAEDRCVGVMTKADLLPRETNGFSSWLSMLNEQAHRTGLGYFITSRQGSDLDEQNKFEEAFFNRTADSATMGQWPEIFEKYRDRCGIEKLKEFLSITLGREFSKVLPEVKQKVYNRLLRIEEQLEKYPNPPPNPEMEIMRSLAEFATNVKTRVLQQEFMSQWDCLFAEPFKKRILGCKPKFNVKEPDVITIDDNSPMATPAPLGQTPRKRSMAQDIAMTPSKRRGQIKVEDGDRMIMSPSTSATMRGTPGPGSFPFSPGPGGGPPPRSKNLMELRTIIRRSAIPGQPGLVSASVYEPLYTEAARTWGPHLENFVNQTIQFLHNEVMKILDNAFSNLKNRAVYRESVEHMKYFMEKHKEEVRNQLNLIYNLETQRIFTKDEDALQRNKAAEKRILERHRHFLRMAVRTGESPAIRKMEELTEEELVQEQAKMAKELKVIGPDPYDQEITVAAYVRGYYLTAASRFIDIVAIHIMSGLLPRVASVIDIYLHEKLGLYSRTSGSGPEIFMRLMSEGPETERKRGELRVEKERLDQAMEIIVNLENKEQMATATAANSQATQMMSQGGHAGQRPELSIRTNANGGVATPVSERAPTPIGTYEA